MSTRTSRKIPLLDLNQSAFHLLHGDEPILEMQQGGRVAFLHEPSRLFYNLAGRYNGNEATPILDFVNCQRQLRARMIAMKNGNGGGQTSGNQKTV